MLSLFKFRLPRLALTHQLFLLFVLFSFFPLAASNIWGYQTSRKNLATVALQNLRNVALMEAEKTATFVKEVLQSSHSIVKNKIFLQHAQTILQSGHRRRWLQARQKIQSYFTTQVSTHPVIEMISLFRGGGVLLAKASQTTEPMISQHFCVEPRGGASSALTFLYPEHEPLLVVALPLRIPSQPTSVVCLYVKFDVHHKLVKAHKEHTSRASVYLLDKDSKVICGSFHDLHRAPYGRQLYRNFVEHRKSHSQAWSEHYQNHAGVDVLGAFASVPHLGWRVLVEVPTERALRSLELLKKQSILFACFLLCFLSIGILFTASRLGRQLGSLTEASGRMADGKLGEIVEPSGPKEFIQLTHSFNRMSRVVEESHQLLEQRIVERTKELETNEAFIKLLLDSIGQEIVVISLSSLIIKANKDALRVYGSDMIGKPYYQVLEGLDSPHVNCPVQTTFLTGQPASDERSMGYPRQEEIIHLTTYPVFTEGEVSSVLQMGRIVTDEKKREAQMLHQEKMAAFGTLAAGIAHDIGNPLASIQSQLEMALSFPDTHQTQETLQFVRKEVARISRLLRELADLTRRKETLSLLLSPNRAITDVVRLLRHDPRARGITIQTQLEAHGGIYTQRDHLEQVLLNLGLNALDAMPNGGVLQIKTLNPTEESIEIQFLDTGGGIPEDLVDKIFTPFFTTKSVGKGTGLGLFVSKSLIEQMGGSLVLRESTAKGSVFVVTLSLSLPSNT